LEVVIVVVERANGNEFGGVCMVVEGANSRRDFVDGTISGYRWFCIVEDCVNMIHHFVVLVRVHDCYYVESEKNKIRVRKLLTTVAKLLVECLGSSLKRILWKL
jgi:hypothetical protein